MWYTKLWCVNTNIKLFSLCTSGLKSGIFSRAEFPSQKACGRCWFLCYENYPLRSLELQASVMPSKSVTLSTAGLAGLWALKLVQNPRWPLGYTNPHILWVPSLRQPDTLSLATLKAVSAVNELLGSSKTILTFLKGTEKNKNKTSPKNLQLLTRSAL